jgi:solute carrier family 13 (sodium-dependent dicarboxylate transporter), member 2/3/5
MGPATEGPPVRGPSLAASLPDETEPSGGLRRTLGWVLAPSLFAALLLMPLPALEPEAHRLAAVMAAVVVLWITEALPMPVTALLGAAACVVMRVAPAKEVFAPFADPLMFLFIGSFILTRALFVHRLDRRLAFGVLALPGIGAKPGRILVAFGAVTWFLSWWVSNTGTAAMMFPIGVSILAFLRDEGRPGPGPPPIRPGYATGLMLMTSFAASVGGFATPVGSAPNVIGLGFIRELPDGEFTFFQWCMVGVPIAVVLFLFVAFYLHALCPAGVEEVRGGDGPLKREAEAVGPWTTGQRSTVAACAVVVLLWVVPGLLALAIGEDSRLYRFLHLSFPEGVVALIAAGLLFLLPGDRGGRALTWDEAARIDWGTILLFGGGFALGVLSFQTGLAEALGRGLTSLLPIRGELPLLCAATVVATLVSEVTSNTASANMVVPVVIAIAQASGVDPLEPALGATFGSGLGFMLPVSTPPNAIVYGSGYVPLRRMIAYGVLLDVVGAVVIVAMVRLIVPLAR